MHTKSAVRSVGSPVNQSCAPTVKKNPSILSLLSAGVEDYSDSGDVNGSYNVFEAAKRPSSAPFFKGLCGLCLPIKVLISDPKPMFQKLLSLRWFRASGALRARKDYYS